MSVTSPDPIVEEKTARSTATETASSANASSKTRKRRKSNRYVTQVLKLVRRIHLYSGLVMFPWVMLYGFTALLFNRPTTFPDAEIVHFEQPAQSSDTSLPEDYARQIVAALNEAELKRVESLEGDQAPREIRLVNSEDAHFNNRAFWSIREDDRQITIVSNLNDGSGYVRITDDPSEDDEEETATPLDEIDQLSIDADKVNQLFVSALKDAIDEESIPNDQLSSVRIPTLEFDIEIDGQIVPVEYSTSRNSNNVGRSNTPARSNRNESPRPPRPPITETEEKLEKSGFARSGSIAMAESPSDTNMTWRRYLLRLHTAHGYPVEDNARWYWAIIVDLMFASMCFWGLSGMVMWWQIKKTRRWGAFFVVFSAIAATWLAISMHAEMVS